MESKQSVKELFLPADFVMDNAKMRDNLKYLSLLEETERLVLSENLKKFAPCNIIRTEHMLVFTDQNIYNMKKEQIKRSIPLNSLVGVTKSMLGSKDEFVLHFEGTHDHRYLVKDTNVRKEIIDVLKRLYADQFQQNLPIYAVDEKNLKDFTTVKKLVKQGKSKIPPK